MPEEQLIQIFDRFYQGDNSLSRSNEGSGIGLCIVQELIKLHKGTIKVKSELGKGSLFTITLPLIQINEREKRECISSMEIATSIELSDALK